MKKILFFLICVSSASFAASTALSVDEVRLNLESNGVRAMDWYVKGDTQFANGGSSISKTKVALSNEKGFASVTLVDASDYKFSVSVCWTLADLIPREHSNGWNDPASKDEELMYSIFNENLPQYKQNEGSLNGWKLKIERGFDTFNCSVVKQ